MDVLSDYGPIICTKGKNKGRIGYYDDIEPIECEDCDKIECKCRDCDIKECHNCDEEMNCPQQAIIYWGDMLMCIAINSPYCLMNFDEISDQITMKDLLSRREECWQELKNKSYRHKSQMLIEMMYIEHIIDERYFTSRFLSQNGHKLFISHSSEDKWLAFQLYSDLAERGHDPWLYEWNIKGGMNIPKEISQALDASDYLIVILSNNSVKSNWVQAEWLSMFWDEINDNSTKVIPLLIEKCKLPRFLSNKQYVDFSQDYNKGLQDLLISIQ